MPNRPINPEGGFTAPLWVGLVTFAICWGLGGFILYSETQAAESDKWVLAFGFLLIVFPYLSFRGLGDALVKAIAERVGGRE